PLPLLPDRSRELCVHGSLRSPGRRVASLARGRGYGAARARPAASDATGAGAVPGERVLECCADISVPAKSEGKSITCCSQRRPLPACCRLGPLFGPHFSLVFVPISRQSTGRISAGCRVL